MATLSRVRETRLNDDVVHPCLWNTLRNLCMEAQKCNICLARTSPTQKSYIIVTTDAAEVVVFCTVDEPCVNRHDYGVL